MDPLFQNLVEASTAEIIIQSLKKIRDEPDDVKYRTEELRDIVLQKRAIVSKILAEELQLQSDIPDQLSGAFGEFFLWLMPHQEQRKEEGMRGQKLCMSQEVADFMAKMLLPYAASADSVYFISRSICRLTYDAKTARKYCTSRQIMDILVAAFPRAKSDRSLEFLVSALNNITLHNSEATKLLMNQRCADGFVQALEEVVPESDGVEWVGRALYNIVSHAEDDDDNDVTTSSSSAAAATSPSRTNSTSSPSSSKGYYQHQKEVCYCTPKMLRALVNALRLRTKSAGSIEYIADCITEVMSPTSSCENEEMKEIFENEECVELLFSQLDRVADMHDQCVYGLMNALGAISRSSKPVAKIIAENERYMNRIMTTIKEATIPYILQVFSTIICNVTHHHAASAEFFSKEENIEILMRALELSLAEPETNSSVALVLNNLTSLSKEAVKSIANPKWEAMLLKSLKEFTDCESDTGVERIACVLTNVTRTSSEFATRLGSSQEAIRTVSGAFAVACTERHDGDEAKHEVASFSSSSSSLRAEYWLDVVVNNIVGTCPTSISSFAAFDPRVTRVEVEILRAKSLGELMLKNFVMSSITQIGKLPRYRLWTLFVRKCSQLLEEEFEKFNHDNEDNIDFPERCYLVQLMHFLQTKMVGTQSRLNEEYTDFFFLSVLPRARRTTSATLLISRFATEWRTETSTEPLTRAEISVLLQIIRRGYRDGATEIEDSKLVSAILDILRTVQLDPHQVNLSRDSALTIEMKQAFEEARRRGICVSAEIANFKHRSLVGEDEDDLTFASSSSDEYDDVLN